MDLSGHFEVAEDSAKVPDGKHKDWFSIPLHPEFRDGKIVAFHAAQPVLFRAENKGSVQILWAMTPKIN